MGNFTDYEREAMRTAPPTRSDTDDLILGALGLAGEAGEYADHIKKQLYHNHPKDRENALDEAGDVLWYLAHIARQWQSSLGDIAYRNVIKLRKRYPEGFQPEKSINREEWR